MAFTIVTFRHPIMRTIRLTPLGFSWTMLFFGMLVPLFRNDWKHFLISTVLAILTSGFSWLIYPFWYNYIYARNLIKDGFLAEHLGRASKKRFSDYVGNDHAAVALDGSETNQPTASVTTKPDTIPAPAAQPDTISDPALEDPSETEGEASFWDNDDDITENFWRNAFVTSATIAVIYYALSVLLFSQPPTEYLSLGVALIVAFEMPLTIRFSIWKSAFPPQTTLQAVIKWVYRAAYFCAVMAVLIYIRHDEL